MNLSAEWTTAERVMRLIWEAVQEWRFGELGSTYPAAVAISHDLWSLIEVHYKEHIVLYGTPAQPKIMGVPVVITVASNFFGVVGRNIAEKL